MSVVFSFTLHKPNLEANMPDSTQWDEIKDELYDGVIDGDEPTVSKLTQGALDDGMPAEEVLYDALIPALEEVGSLFESGGYFVPEMLTGAKAMKAGLNLLRPILARTGAKPIGAYVLLTVKGDIHDIGKDLVRVMLEGSGFNVIDLGVNVSPETLIEAVKEHQPEIVGFSAFLTTTMPMFKTNIDALIEAGLRDKVKVMVGGAPITEEYAMYIGADGFATEASTASRIAIDFIKNSDNSRYLLKSSEQADAKTYSRIQGTVDLPTPKRHLVAKPAMKSLERVLAVLNHEEPDRVPHFEWVHDLDLIKSMTKGGGYWDLVELLNLDGVMTGPVYRKKSLGGDMLCDEWGAVRQIGKDNYAMPVDTQAPVQTLQDLEEWQVPAADEDFRYETIQATIDRFGGERAIILQMRDVWSGPRDYILAVWN